MKTSVALGATNRQAGFTLVELLVVMLILGILAAIALPAFFNQKSKAGDAKAKETAHAAQVAMETCNTDNKGVYSTTNCTLAGLRAIEPTIPSSEISVEPNVPVSGYTITVTATSKNTFSVSRSATGALTYTCTVNSSNRGGCPGSGIANGTWG